MAKKSSSKVSAFVGKSMLGVFVGGVVGVLGLMITALCFPFAVIPASVGMAAVASGAALGLGGVSLHGFYKAVTSDKNNSGALVGSVIASAGVGASIGAILGTVVFPGLGTAAGAIIGSVIGSLSSIIGLTALTVFKLASKKSSNPESDDLRGGTHGNLNDQLFTNTKPHTPHNTINLVSGYEALPVYAQTNQSYGLYATQTGESLQEATPADFLQTVYQPRR